MANCDVISNNIDDSVSRTINAFTFDAESAINDFIGSKHEASLEFNKPGKENSLALKAHGKLHDMLLNRLTENAAAKNYIDYDPSITIDPLKDYVQNMYSMYGSKQTIIKSGPRRIISASKTIGDLLNLQETRGGKGLNKIERQILPPVAFALSNDKFGYIYKFFKKVVSVTEEYRRKTSKFKARHNSTMSKLMSSIDATLAIQDIFTEEWVPKGSGIDGLHGLRDRAGNRLIFLGSFRDKSGAVLHNIIYEETNERKAIEENEIPRSSIIASLLNYYTYDMINDLLDGQMKYVVWDNNPDDEDMLQIQNVYHKINVKRNLEDTELSKIELSKGIPEIHEIKYRDIVYQYIMTKKIDPLLGGAEVYHAIVTRIKYSDGRIENIYGKKGGKSKKINISMFRDGFYRSNNFKTYGKAINKFDELAQYDESDWADFTFMSQQPHSLVSFAPDVVAPTATEIVGEHRIQYNTLWEAISQIRALYDDVFDNSSLLMSEEFKSVNNWFAVDKKGEYNNIQTMINNAFGVDKGKEIYNSIISTLSSIVNLHIDDEGSINMPLSTFKRKSNNYSPRLYEFSVINDDIVAAMDEIADRIADLSNEEGTEDRIAEAKEALNDLKITLAFVNDNEDMIKEAINTNNLNLLRKNRYSKHRSLWTNPAHRRKDPLAFNDYLDGLFYGIERMSLLASLLNTISNISSTKPVGLESIIESLVNRTKIGLFDPTSKASIGNIDYSYERVASILNSLPGTNRTWDAKSAMNFITTTRGLISAALLGSSSALVNRTQIANEWIRFGWDAISRATSILDDQDDREPKAKWDAIIEHVGTDEISNMFMDVMAQTGDLRFADAAILKIPGVPFQIPKRALFDIFSMLKRGRKDFSKSSIPVMDEYIRTVEASRLKGINNKAQLIKAKMEAVERGLKNKQDVKSVKKFLALLNREYNRLTSQKERRNIESLKESFFDLILTSKEDNNYSNLSAKFTKIMGDIGDNRLKRAISWKMSWWFPGFGKELFTFSEGERTMRKQSVVINLLTADAAGILGSSDKLSDVKYTYNDPMTGKQIIGNIPERFLNNTAVSIARNGVSNTMFGMSMVNLGEAFSGGGSQLFLYKAYPLQQMLHDYRIFKSFKSGNINKYDSITRTYDAFKYLKSKEKYDINDKTLDHDAIAVARFIISRGAMSALSIGVESLGILKRFINTPLTEGIFGMIRGGENPAIGIAMRVLFKLAIFSTLSSDDDSDDVAIDIGWQMAFLLFPVFFTLPLSLIYAWTQ